MHPLGPLMSLAPMGVAIRKAHWGKPIWASAGGAELPVMNVAVATTLLVAGPGVFSADTILRTRLSWKSFFMTVFGLGLGLFWAFNGRAPTTRELADAGGTIAEAVTEPGRATRRARETVAA